MKERIKQEIKSTLALYEIARPWKTPRSELAETIAELSAKDILKLIKEHERKRTKRLSDGLRERNLKRKFSPTLTIIKAINQYKQKE